MCLEQSIKCNCSSQLLTTFSARKNKHFEKVLNKGDVFVFPKGLVHYQYNNRTTGAVAIAALSSQNPGVITLANAVFGAEPSIPAGITTKAFQVEKSTVDWIQAQF